MAEQKLSLVVKEKKQNKDAECNICHKFMRKDNLKRHQKSCVKKKSVFIDDQAEESDKENNPPQGEESHSEHESDREFINDDSDVDELDEVTRREVDERLEQLREARRLQEIELAKENKKCEHCYDWIPKNEHFEHEKKCLEKIVKCFKCKKELACRYIKKHFRECKAPYPDEKTPKKKKSKKKKKRNGKNKKKKGKKKKKKKKKKKTKKPFFLIFCSCLFGDLSLSL